MGMVLNKPERGTCSPQKDTEQICVVNNSSLTWRQIPASSISVSSGPQGKDHSFLGMFALGLYKNGIKSISGLSYLAHVL